MIFDPVQLRTLVAIAESGSFTKAAARVHLTQSAISLQIKRLEEKVGRKLIERGARTIVLTQEGELLLSFARRILTLHKEAEGLLVDLDLGGHVRFGAPEYFDTEILAMLLAQFRRQHPRVQLEITIGLGSAIREMFNVGDLDIAILNVELGQSDDPLLGRDDRVWVAGVNFHRQVENALPLVLFPQTCEWRRLATGILDRHCIPWTVALTSSGVAGLIAGVEAGLGISILASSSAGERLQVLGPEGGLPLLPPFEYRLAERPAAPPAAQRLAFTIREVFGTFSDL
jgi:DNA-binding transcriptional LysR family regulator